jgi:LPXTG-motif cell wall-anchored protein
VSQIGLSWILFASFAMVFIGMILMMIASFTQGHGSTSGGAIILVGPIPIILGSGPESTWMILLAAMITVIALAAFLLTRRKMYR